jgi:hypothetical protein
MVFFILGKTSQPPEPDAMMNALYIFTNLYLVASCAALMLSFWIFSRLKKTLSLTIRLAIVSGCLLSLLASLVPACGIVLTLAFVPSFIYHSLNPLYIAPFVVGVIGFTGAGCALVLARELYSLMFSSSTPPKLGITVGAFIIFCGMGYSIRGGAADYRIVLHTQQIARYAPVGTEADKLEDIYTEVVQSTDARMQGDTMALLALNQNSPPQLLSAIYNTTGNLSLDPVNREHIYRTLLKNPNTTADLFEKLMLSLSQTKSANNVTGSQALPQNNHVSPETILQLADYPDCEVRRAIISYPNVSADVLATMSQHDPDLGVRREAKQRLEFIRGVAHLENSSQAPVVTHAPPLSPLKIISLDNAVKLRQIFEDVADNDDAAIILESLASNCFISDELARRLYDRASELKHYPRTAILKALASNPETPIDVLNELATEKDLAVLRELAANPNLPGNAIVKLSAYPDCKIRKKIICSPDTTTAMLKLYRHDKDESVAFEANNRLAEKEDYLRSCVELKKMNASCQKYYSNTSPDIRLYPNTSSIKKFLGTWG